MVNAFASLGVTANAITVDSIAGPTELEDDDTYEWEVHHSGGDGRNTYEWEILWDDSTSWNELSSTEETQELYVEESDGSFWLKATVSWTGGSDEDSIYVANQVDPVSVTGITGPTSVDTAGTYEWGVDFTGGAPGNVSYLWEVYWDSYGQWVWAGENETQQFTLDEGDGSFDLRVTVSSVGTEDSDTQYVTNWIGCQNPPFCEEPAPPRSKQPRRPEESKRQR